MVNVEGSEMIEILLKIKENPYIYLGKKSIFRLRSFLDGYLYAMKNNEYTLFLNSFQKWVAKRYEIKTTQGWSEIINFFSIDEIDAFDKFYVLLNQFFYERDEEPA